MGKKTHPEKLLDYDNLTLACSVCNTKKGDYDDENVPLLNPYIDDLNSELLALGPMIWQKLAKVRGETTVRVVGLNRSALVEQRQERIEAVSGLADKYESLPKGDAKKAIRKELLREAESDREFSFVVRGYLKQVVLLSS
ncbi:MAG: hypothetical protein IIC86_03430 [Chloroflexi bacterium]|nr:hypothetical protein [Chloroflexota bacterium]